MWFKNLHIYSLSESFEHSPEDLNELLAKFAAKPCNNTDPSSYGWTPPLGRNGTEYVHAVSNYIMVCGKRQEKVLPASVIKEELDEKVEDISSRESRSVGRTEKQSLKEEIIFSLMPKAFVKSSYDFAYIDTKNKLIVVNTSSTKRAEELLSALREALGSLKAIPLTPLTPPGEVLTSWLTGSKIPDDIEIGEECELGSINESRSVKFKNQNLWVDQVSQHIKSGLSVTKLAINWKDSIECIVDEQFYFKRLKYGNDITEQAADHNSDGAVDQFDVEFSVMTLELAAFIRAMSEAFGGVQS